jgi:hypothetical protein
MKALLITASLILALVNCSSDEPRRKGAPPGPNGFAEEDAPPKNGAAVLLRGRTSDGARVTVDVVARGTDRPIQGAAFRLHWDPEKTGFLEAHGSGVWSKQSVFLAKEGLPGELVIVWAEKGSGAAVHANDETVLGSIDFQRKTPDGADVTFRPERSTLRDSSGATIAVDWRGGRVAGQ